MEWREEGGEKRVRREGGSEEAGREKEWEKRGINNNDGGNFQQLITDTNLFTNLDLVEGIP